MNIPNILTLARIAFIPLLVVFFYLPFSWSMPVAAGLFALAAVTDWLDGYLARRWDQATSFGAFLDPVADKLMVAVALALLIERFPYMDNAQIRDVLLTTATDLGAPGVDPIYGWGLINLERAIEGPGQIRVDTDFIVDRMAGGTKVWAGLAWDDWTNDIGGPGRLTKSGVGWLRLSGDNTFGGATVREGILELDGSNALSADVVIAGGHLFLNGSLLGTDLRIDSGSALVRGSVSGGQTLVGVDGLLAGTGLLMLIRHHASLGGIGVLAIWLQRTRGWRAGTVQMIADCLILATALLWVSPWLVALSVLGALAVNMVIAINHRPGRYFGM